MIRKVIDILKVRWPEVVLVVVLHAAMVLLVEDVVAASENMDARGAAPPFGVSFLLGMGMVLCGILWQMLYLGFLKTAAMSGDEPKQPMQLLRTGRPYFWRIVLFQITLGFFVMLLNGVFMSVFGRMIWPGRSVEDLPIWFAQLCALAGILIVLKPMLLVPARVIVYNVTVIEAFFQIRFYRLGQIEGFFKAVIIGSGVIVLSVLPSVLMAAEGPRRYILSGVYSTASSLVLLVWVMAAVLWLQQQFDTEMINESENENE